MKISIVTAVRNAAPTLPAMLESLARQTYQNIEHVVQDGGSTDGSLDILAQHGLAAMALVSARDAGIYAAINAGISRASGDIIGLLHADDVLASPDVLAWVADTMADPAVDGVYGDLQYVARDNPARLVRHWVAGDYHAGLLARGWMPPHPTVYLRRRVFDQLGLYDGSFQISGDYDAILRYLCDGRVTLRYIPHIMVRMTTGGASNRSLSQILRKSREDYRAIRRHNIGGFTTLLRKNTSKLRQLF
jgi:glycosyltransferase involved in cell wall biosynthesis